MSGTRRPIRIGIELINDPNWMGGVLYLQNLAVCLSRLPAHERPFIELLGASDVVGKFVAESRLAGGLSGKVGLLRRVARKIGLKVDQPAIDVVYPGFGSTVAGAIKMHWIPDFQHRYLPHLFSDDEIAARDRSIAELAAKPGVIVFSSEVAAKDFHLFHPAPVATARVWHFCSLIETSGASDNSVVEKYGLPEKFLYLPNQFWAHKNHEAVLKSLTILKRDYGLVIPLVCTGVQSDRRNEGHFSSLLSFIEENGLENQIRLLGLVDRGDQIEIFRRAAAVVQPSLFEGWSTVVEDTRAIGRPIFLSDLPVHREQNPARCTYFAPHEPSDLAEKLAARWPGLAPGPDLTLEESARHEMEGRILNSARMFHDIAMHAVRIGSA